MEQFKVADDGPLTARPRLRSDGMGSKVHFAMPDPALEYYKDGQDPFKRPIVADTGAALKAHSD